MIKDVISAGSGDVLKILEAEWDKRKTRGEFKNRRLDESVWRGY